ncbi:MAG: hypothetical protein ACYC91_04750 [Solirubrobacteraceae bacterium]
MPAARRALRSANCQTGRIRRIRSRQVRQGRVIVITPRPESRRRTGTRVNLLISSGP